MEKSQEKALWKKKARPVIYMMAGLYLLIMDFYIIQSASQSSETELLIMAAAAVLFTLCGAGMVIWGIVAVCRREKHSEDC